MATDIKIAYCQITNDYWSEHALNNIRRARPYVDMTILVYDGINDITRGKLYQENVYMVEKPFNNNFPAFRQHYLDEARKLGATHVLVSDRSEFIEETFLSSLRSK